MTLLPSSRGSRAVAIAVGVALIVAPLLALVVKYFSFGWLVVALLMLLVPIPLMVLGYVVQLVIAIGSILRPNGALRTAPGLSRAVIAAWVTSIGVVLTAFFLVDGGDMSFGSTFMFLFGMDSDPQAEVLSTVLAWIGAAAWLLGWLWLVIEWIRAITQRRRATA